MTKLRLVIPKGSIQGSIETLINDAGMSLRIRSRDYRPDINDEDIEVKMMRPQNIPKLIEMGSHDLGFTGHDWVVESGVDVKEVMDLGLDPVRIVAAVPNNTDVGELKGKRIVVATEYDNISGRYLEERGYDFMLLRTYGATEAFPPDDADMIIDNTATGRTIKEHDLRITDTVMESSTMLVANKEAMEDQWKREKIEQLATIFRAVLDARGRVMLEMNVPKDNFEAVVEFLPCMRSPTVAPLYAEEGYAVKIAVMKHEVPKLIPKLREMGATDILEYDIRKVIA